MRLPGQTSTNRSQNVVREPPPEPPGSAPGGPRRPQEAPRAPQDGPKTRQERPKSRPEPVSERPGWPSGALLAPKRPPGALPGTFLTLLGATWACFGGPWEAQVAVWSFSGSHEALKTAQRAGQESVRRSGRRRIVALLKVTLPEAAHLEISAATGSRSNSFKSRFKFGIQLIK